VELGLSGKRQPRRSRRPDADVGLFERTAADVLAASGHAARQLDEIDEVAAADRQRLNLRGRHHATEIHLARLDERRLAAHGDDLRHRAEIHNEIDLCGTADRQHDARPYRRLEILQLGANVVDAGIERGDPIAAGAVGGSAARRSGARALDRERHTWQRRTGFIGDDAIECGGGNLSGRLICRRCEDDEGERSAHPTPRPCAHSATSLRSG
jgi:hypothetical protein